MRVTRVDPLIGPLVEVELVALQQMEKALRGFVDRDLDASEMKTVAGQLADGPLLQNAVSIPSHPSGEQGEEARNWLIGPGDDGTRVLDGPAAEENIAVVPQHLLDAAEERLKEIARGESEPWRRRNAEAVEVARDYFDGRTQTMEQTPATDPSKEERERQVLESEKVRASAEVRLLDLLDGPNWPEALPIGDVVEAVIGCAVDALSESGRAAS